MGFAGSVLRFLFFLLVVRPIVMVILGLNVRNRHRLPSAGPAIIAANHNSHLDTMILMTLFPMRLIGRIRPVAAADYFLRNRIMEWFSTRIIGIIPIDRSGATPRESILDGVHEAMRRRDIVILFPEGSRGEPERLGAMKSGVAHLAAAHPSAEVVPVFIHGAGKVLPKGEALFVPFFCDVLVGEPVPRCDDRHEFMDRLSRRMSELAAEGDFAPWE